MKTIPLPASILDYRLGSTTEAVLRAIASGDLREGTVALNATYRVLIDAQAFCGLPGPEGWDPHFQKTRTRRDGQRYTSGDDIYNAAAIRDEILDARARLEAAFIKLNCDSQ